MNMGVSSCGFKGWGHSGCKHDKDVGISCGKHIHLFFWCHFGCNHDKRRRNFLWYTLTRISWCHSGCNHDKDVGISSGKRMHLFKSDRKWEVYLRSTSNSGESQNNSMNLSNIITQTTNTLKRGVYI